MLVLSRKCGQRILIGDVVVTVVRTGRDAVRLGIDAPRAVKVIREELQKAPRQQGVASS